MISQYSHSLALFYRRMSVRPSCVLYLMRHSNQWAMTEVNCFLYNKSQMMLSIKLTTVTQGWAERIKILHFFLCRVLLAIRDKVTEWCEMRLYSDPSGDQNGASEAILLRSAENMQAKPSYVTHWQSLLQYFGGRDLMCNFHRQKTPHCPKYKSQILTFFKIQKCFMYYCGSAHPLLELMAGFHQAYAELVVFWALLQVRCYY